MFISKMWLIIITFVLLYLFNKVDKERRFFRSRLYTIFVLIRKLEIASHFLPKEYGGVYLYKMKQYINTLSSTMHSDLDWSFYHDDLKLKTKAFEYAESVMHEDFDEENMKELNEYIRKITC